MSLENSTWRISQFVQSEHLCVEITMPNDENGAIYFSTENEFPSSVLRLNSKQKTTNDFTLSVVELLYLCSTCFGNHCQRLLDLLAYHLLLFYSELLPNQMSEWRLL